VKIFHPAWDYVDMWLFSTSRSRVSSIFRLDFHVSCCFALCRHLWLLRLDWNHIFMGAIYCFKTGSTLRINQLFSCLVYSIQCISSETFMFYDLLMFVCCDFIFKKNTCLDLTRFTSQIWNQSEIIFIQE
jgi:hypothetical protein